MFAQLENNAVLLLVGRVMLGLIYAMGALNLLQGGAPVDYAANGAKFVALPAIIVWIGYTLKAVSGICVIIGFQTRLAALYLIVFTIITALNYQEFGGIIFMKEVSMIGGFLVLLAAGPGPLSIDKR